jgi:hypothetical protein
VNETGSVGFVASVDAGPTPIAAFLTSPSGTAKIAAVGDSLPGGGTLATFSLYPVISVSPTGSATFATAPTATGEGVEGIYVAMPAR